MISSYFDFIEFKVQHREFVTHTGIYKGKRVSAVSTGIGTDNIDIFLNEADALYNINFKTRRQRKKKIFLNIVRIGTSGALQENIPVNSFVASQYGLGLDGLLHFYSGADKTIEKKFSSSFLREMNWNKKLPMPYAVKCSRKLFLKICSGMISGITVTAPGFYAPQGRRLRLSPYISSLEKKLSAFSYNHLRPVNFEMETSALYGLARLLGHHACTVCIIVGNRISKKFSEDYRQPFNELIQIVLDRI
jgi:uridine phosphorylase